MGNLLEKCKGKYAEYWKSRRLIQRSLFDSVNDKFFKTEPVESSFRLFPKRDL